MAQRCCTIETEHDDMIHDAQLNYYGTNLATASSDCTVKIFRVDSQNRYELIQTLEKHDGPVWQVRWIHPNFAPHQLVSCGYDKRIIVWAEHSQGQGWEEVYKSELHKASVNAVDVAPADYGFMIVAGSSDQYISCYACINNSWVCKMQRAHQGGVNGVSWCKSATLGDSQERTFATCGCDNTVGIWNCDAETLEITKLHTLKGHQDWVRDVSWAPSPAQASVAVVASCSEDNTVIIWTFRRGVWTQGDEAETIGPFEKRVWSVSWSQMGNILAVAQGEEDVVLFKEGQDGKWAEVADEQYRADPDMRR